MNNCNANLECEQNACEERRIKIFLNDPELDIRLVAIRSPKKRPSHHKYNTRPLPLFDNIAKLFHPILDSKQPKEGCDESPNFQRDPSRRWKRASS